MRNAPSVSYPVGRCAFQRWLYLFLSGLTSAVLLAWAWSQDLTVAWFVAVACAVLGAGLGWHALQQQGLLTWDGKGWCLHGRAAADDACGDVFVTLDLQTTLLLRWQPTSDTLHAKPQWLWLSAQNSMGLWQNLRRAVYQRTDG